jgi:hypothetical protein
VTIDLYESAGVSVGVLVPYASPKFLQTFVATKSPYVIPSYNIIPDNMYTVVLCPRTLSGTPGAPLTLTAIKPPAPAMPTLSLQGSYLGTYEQGPTISWTLGTATGLRLYYGVGASPSQFTEFTANQVYSSATGTLPIATAQVLQSGVLYTIRAIPYSGSYPGTVVDIQLTGKQIVTPQISDVTVAKVNGQVTVTWTNVAASVTDVRVSSRLGTSTGAYQSRGTTTGGGTSYVFASGVITDDVVYAIQLVPYSVGTAGPGTFIEFAVGTNPYSTAQASVTGVTMPSDTVVAWTNVTAVSKVRVYYGTGTSLTLAAELSINAAAGSTSSYTFTQLVAGTTYNIQVLPFSIGAAGIPTTIVFQQTFFPPSGLTSTGWAFVQNSDVTSTQTLGTTAGYFQGTYKITVGRSTASGTPLNPTSHSWPFVWDNWGSLGPADSTGTAWREAAYGYYVSGTNQTFSYAVELPFAILLTKYGVRSKAFGHSTPSSWTFRASNDGANWTTLDTRAVAWESTAGAPGRSQLQTFNVAPSMTYKYFEFNATRTNSFTDLCMLLLYTIAILPGTGTYTIPA